MTNPLTRRRMVIRIACAGVALTGAAARAAPARVDEADEGAVALGYRHDTRQVDGKKFATHSPEQRCANCSFWQGQPGDAWAGCSMFGRKQIAASGWCAAWRRP
ncbi:MAG TPA: high-potential iron-sulfur protein [Ideonella sp.]|uniref:high-potential iron-sulfur protein n=1 Tax=Ideonella sp. TaxID=1929293 RepID=UPI002E2F76AF|nr:high-potential iron-sulfur protein [Ideonella sp.]HEX5685400.1 high-potential iron-sulfur protein [Ideonella sp.]